MGFLLLLLFGRRGPAGAFLEKIFGIHLVFTAAGAALATAVMAFPLLVRAIRLSFEATDARLFEAAAVLRAGPLDRFLTIALPLAVPGILAGAVTAFAAGMGEFGAVITFAGNIPGETRTLPLAIYGLLQEPGGGGQTMRLALISFARSAMCGLISAELLQALDAPAAHRMKQLESMPSSGRAILRSMHVLPCRATPSRRCSGRPAAENPRCWRRSRV